MSRLDPTRADRSTAGKGLEDQRYSRSMGYLRRKLSGRFPLLGRFSDLAIVGNAGLRLAHRRGLIDDDMAKRFGATTSSGGDGLSAAELALAGAALLRLAKRARNRGSNGPT